jgi:hypothetical protein
MGNHVDKGTAQTSPTKVEPKAVTVSPHAMPPDPSANTLSTNGHSQPRAAQDGSNVNGPRYPLVKKDTR